MQTVSKRARITSGVGASRQDDDRAPRLRRDINLTNADLYAWQIKRLSLKPGAAGFVRRATIFKKGKKKVWHHNTGCHYLQVGSGQTGLCVARESAWHLQKL